MSEPQNQAAFGRPVPRSEPPARPDDRCQFVVFALDGQQYGVDIMSVREIRMMQPITYLPGAPDYVCGVINLRGSIVPVCDLRSRYGQGRTDPVASNAIVIVSIEGKLNGLLVDEVLDIVAIPSEKVSPVPEVQANRSNPLFKGLITAPNGMLIILDLAHLLPPRTLDEAAPAPAERAN